jgi:hypothetical protein
MHLALSLLLLSPGCIRVDDEDFAARVDRDGDGHRSAEYGGGDCDDGDATVNTDAVERCNGVDDNCDGVTDNTADADTYWADADGDGYGDPESSVLSCDGLPAGFVDDNTDCDDTTAVVNPSAPEDCNGIDDDCNPATEDPETVTWYADSDGDGYGDDATAVQACMRPSADHVLEGADCDDSTPDASPGNTSEVCNDGLDNDCDGGHDGCGWSGENSLEAAGRPIIGTEDGMRAGAAIVVVAGLTDQPSTVAVGAPGGGRFSGWEGDGGVFLVDANISPGAQQRLVDRADIELGGADATAEGGESDPAAGSALAAGDADGDGIADLLIGAPGPGGGPGAAWLLTGPITGDANLSMATSALWLTGATTPTTGTGGEAGRALQMADVDSDLQVELLIGAPGLGTSAAPATGAVFLVDGSNTGRGSLDDAVRIEGRAAGGRLGTAFATIDLDGDGLHDIVLGAPTLELGGVASAGEVSILLGPIDADITTADADVRLETGGYSDIFGAGLAAIGDVTGDGQPDVALSAPGRSSLAGASWVLDGMPASDGKVWDEAVSRIDGPIAGGLLGVGVAGTGDVDADGIDDLLVGAPGSGVVGEAWLLHGPLPGGGLDPSAIGATFLGAGVDDLTGSVLGGGVDLTGDAAVDLVFGLPGLSATGGGDEGGGVVIVPGEGF